jgi:hypothetical protein
MKSSGISFLLKAIVSIYRCCWNVGTFKWKISHGKIEIIYFVVHCRSQPALCQFLGEGQDKKQTLLYMWYSLLVHWG